MNETDLWIARVLGKKDPELARRMRTWSSYPALLLYPPTPLPRLGCKYQNALKSCALPKHTLTHLHTYTLTRTLTLRSEQKV